MSKYNNKFNMVTNIIEELIDVHENEKTNHKLQEARVLLMQAWSIELDNEKIKNKKNIKALNKQQIFDLVMEEASKVLGADPAYFGEEGAQEVERQLNKLGYTLEELRTMED